MVWFSGLLVIATFALAYIALKTDRTLQAQQRAWIAPHHAIISSKMQAGENFVYSVEYGNIGKEPATNIVINQAEEAIPFDIKLGSWETIFAKAKVTKYDCNSFRPNPGGFVVYPSIAPERTYGVDTRKLLPDESEVLRGDKILLVKGCFGYVTLNEPHYSWFCFFWPPFKGGNPNTGVSFVCPAGTNGAD